MNILFCLFFFFFLFWPNAASGRGPLILSRYSFRKMFALGCVFTCSSFMFLGLFLIDKMSATLNEFSSQKKSLCHKIYSCVTSGQAEKCVLLNNHTIVAVVWYAICEYVSKWRNWIITAKIHRKMNKWPFQWRPLEPLAFKG